MQDRLLLVDDDASLLKLLVIRLEAEGFEVQTAESAEAARAMVEAIRVVSHHDLGSLELEVEIPSKWNRHGSANLELRVPRDLEVVVIAANGRVSLEGMRGRIRAHLDKDGTLKDAYYVDQSAYAHLDTFKEPATRNAGRVFEQMEFE